MIWDTLQVMFIIFSIHTIEMVTLIPRFPLSANSWAIDVSNTRQSELLMAEATPSWMLLGVASQVSRLLCPFSSNLDKKGQLHEKLLKTAILKKSTENHNNVLCFHTNRFFHPAGLLISNVQNIEHELFLHMELVISSALSLTSSPDVPSRMRSDPPDALSSYTHMCNRLWRQ